VRESREEMNHEQRGLLGGTYAAKEAKASMRAEKAQVRAETTRMRAEIDEALHELRESVDELRDMLAEELRATLGKER
jgi:F0F1-type ATP synthase membrane subunit b/b'